MKFIGRGNEYLHLETIGQTDSLILPKRIEEGLTVLWFESERNDLTIDGKNYHFEKNQIAFLTEFHNVEVNKIGSTKFLRFNRPFYCILDHDAEVGCNGMLFFGASQVPSIRIPDNEIGKMKSLLNVFYGEMESVDNPQIDMLQMLLKRYLILCARFYKDQHQYPDQELETDMVRTFNFLIEKHFRTKHTVAEYADLLSKSPKTISNIFSKIGHRTPLQYIHDRKMLEARRLLGYSDKSIKEIAYEIGYIDSQTFSRFFGKQEGTTPKRYREKALSGTIATP